MDGYIPPVFDYDIVLQDGGSYMEFETLSSGEKQLLNNIGAVIYHLLNIDSSYVDLDITSPSASANASPHHSAADPSASGNPPSA